MHRAGHLLDLRHIAPRAEITPADLEAAVKKAGVPVPKGGTVLLCTGHHERTFPRKEYSSDNSGVNVAATEWLAQQGIVHFGIDSMRPGPEGKVNALVHKACLDLDITHIESLCNLEALLGRGQFTFIGLPMKWRGGTLRQSALWRCLTCEARKALNRCDIFDRPRSAGSPDLPFPTAARIDAP